MNPENELALSFYKPVSDIGGKKDITLVQHIETKELFVRKKLQTFDREVYEALRSESFPFVPAIKEVIEDEEGVILIEEYVQGRSLEEILEERTFSEKETRELVMKICDILRPIHSHQPSIVHRDIKPGNLIIQGNQPYLIDFDISRDYDPEESRDTELMGTKTYAAPEQFGFSQSTARTDVYALGVLMNVMMTGQTPADHPVGGSMGKIIGKCTAMDPDKRYISVDELKTALSGRSPGFAPPGFRSRRPILMIIAGLWYMLILSLTFTVDFNSSDGKVFSQAEIIAMRMIYLVVLGGMTLYLGNYMSILEKFPFKRSKSIPLEILRVLLGSACIILVPLVILVILFP